MYYISLVGVNSRGIVHDHEGIFDIYTKEYDFLGSNVEVRSSQDLWNFYESKHQGISKKEVVIYTMVEFFIQQHSNGHFIIDEFPFLYGK